MLNSFDWLPDLVFLKDYNNDWTAYLDALYVFYKSDFLDSNPKYKNQKVGVKRLPIENGKVSNFWHLIQEGQKEKDRIPDLRRCERIRWPRPIIENSENETILVWPNVRHTKFGIEKNVCLWLKEKEYLVILRKRKGYFLLWTGYLVTNEHRKEKLRKEYEAYKKTGDAISSDPVTPSTHGR